MTSQRETHIANPADNKIRINDYLIGVFTAIPTRKSIKKAIRKERILIDGKTARSSNWVEDGMRIELLEDDPKKFPNYEMDLQVVYEDDYFAVVNKPPGLVSSGNQLRTLQNAVATNLKASSKEDALHPPKLVHRLDSATSGLIIVAKNAESARVLGQMLESQQIKKKYLAIVIGDSKENDRIDTKIQDKEALSILIKKEALPSEKFGMLSLVELYPQSGRTHQLRIHMADCHHPILGDRLYGNKAHDLKGKGLFLVALGLEFDHPSSGNKMKFEIPMPKKFQKYWDGLRKRNANS